ncbi:MAG: GntR family transcriptional regulator [Kiritimatiellae bacterium]|nr:GntR family transcriptional regulator [Kiritimatiellia bacterium]
MNGGTRRRTRRSEGRLLADDPVEAIERAVLRSVEDGGCTPHQKIRSRRELARLLSTTEFRVQQAITRLGKKGLVYTRQGSGIYVSEKAGGATAPAAVSDVPETTPTTVEEAPFDAGAFAFHHVPSRKTLRVTIPLGNDERQRRMWQRALDAFHREFPFVAIEPDFSMAAANASGDLHFMTLDGMYRHDQPVVPLDAALLGQGGLRLDGLCDGIEALGRIVRGPAGAPGDTSPTPAFSGIPVMRTTTVLMANRRVLARYGLANDPILARTTPGRPGAAIQDLFRLGNALEERSGGRVTGMHYVGFHHYATFRGIAFREQGKRCVFDRTAMARFLEDLRPHLDYRRSHIGGDRAEDLFLQDSLGIHCAYLFQYRRLAQRMGDAVRLLALPLEAGGFVTEGLWVGCTPAGTENAEEAAILLGFLASERGQRLLLDEHPEWLSVQRKVLAEQKAASPFPNGSVLYEFDPRSQYTHVSEDFYRIHLPRMETEVAKLFLGIQDLETTLDRMERVPAEPS